MKQPLDSKTLQSELHTVAPEFAAIPRVQVPAPDLTRFDALLSSGRKSAESSSPLSSYDAQEGTLTHNSVSILTTQGGVNHVKADQSEDQPKTAVEHPLLRTNLKQLRLPKILAEHAKFAREAADANQDYS